MTGPRRRSTLPLLAALLAAWTACDRASPSGDSRFHPPDMAPETPEAVHRTERHMGTVFTITVAAPPSAAVLAAIQAAFDEVARVEKLLSNWIPDSQVSLLERAAGGPPLAVGPDLRAVARVAREVSDETHGAFDVTAAACAGHWSGEGSGDSGPAALANCLGRISYRLVQLDEAQGTLRLARPGTRMDLGGIAKGYGLDRAAAVLRDRGLTDFIVEGGGDLVAAGTRFGQPWRCGIQHPRARRGRLLGELVLPPQGVAVATSGDYERYAVRDGHRLPEILDPRTGRPAQGSVSVTVMAPDATRADALATGIFVLGADEGVALAESLPGVEVVVVGDDLELSASSGVEGALILAP